MNKKISVGAAVMLMLMTAAVAVTITMIFSMKMINKNLTDFSARESMFKKLADVDAKVRERYVGKIDETKLEDELINGYMKGISDKYGTYLDAEDYKKIETDIQGKGIGIGVNVIENAEGYINVVSVVKKSPAEAAGVLAGDVIVKIGSEDVKALGYASAVNLLKGDAGTKAEFTVKRNGVEKPFSIVRKQFESQSVESRMIGNLAYVRILEFDSNTDEQFSAQVDNLVKKGAKGIVFDVRNNPGGLLDTVEKMIDKLVPAGPVVRAKYKTGSISTLYRSDAAQISLPMAVLTNQNTASAAELFTAALKDYGKAKSIGTKTYGKGTMQTIFDLNDGTALDLSIAYFYPPKSNNFEGKGVTPDIEVDLSSAKLSRFYQLSDQEDDQLQAGLNYVKTLIQ
ncbi:MAG TPA: S41 family peptidase [Clostridia bacterium]|nr:S41 family peptidase [Clostridia bacterium]